MKIFNANITYSAIRFFEQNRELDINRMNSKVKSICGINSFFGNQQEIDSLFLKISEYASFVSEPDRSEYGDFQTNKELSNRVCKLLKEQNTSPEIIIEPTFGKGNFILACLENFKTTKYIYGIEIYKPYVWETKFAILNYFLASKQRGIPEIYLFHNNIFDFDFENIFQKHQKQNILIIGNPPWVTNAKLSSLESNNLPLKSNFKRHKGLDAITGKGNFDLGEFISLQLLSKFSNSTGQFAFLVKNSVAKNILLEQIKTKYPISGFKQYDIDAKKEFNVSVNACLLTCSLNKNPAFTINEYDLYSKQYIRQYGWVDNKFVANTELYKETKYLDGISPFEWRQGVKHDASKIMELEKINGHYQNKNKEVVEIEEDLVFCLLKSSDLKGGKVNTSRKYTIITQKKTGQNTRYIKEIFPKTYAYLSSNKEIFSKRKSSIYKGKPDFSIFGIGDYSFKPFKVAISGMYKTTRFTLVKPNNNKPIMLDDTCYFIGFDTLVDAEITWLLLNKKITQDFIQSIAFQDAKRMITKDLLMRIDLIEVMKQTSFDELSKMKNISIEDWEKYKSNFTKKAIEKNLQLNLFSNKT